MRGFIEKIINNKQIQIEELNKFIVDYLKLMDKREPTVQEISQIAQLIQMGMMDLRFAVMSASKKLGMQIDTLSYANTGQIIKQYIRKDEDNQSNIQSGE